MLDDVDALVRKHLVHDGAGPRRYTPASDDVAELDGVELSRGLLYQYPQVGPSDEDVTLQVYLGLGSLGGRLWEQEVRVLRRVHNLKHPSLPEILDGGFLDLSPDSRHGALAGGAGYIRTTRFDEFAAEDVDGLVADLHSDRLAAVRHLWLLADGLAVMHDSRIAHRNLWPGTLQSESGVDPWRLRLARFEMSTMLNNLLRAGSLDSHGAEVVRGLYRVQHERSLLYAPPERLRLLLATPDPGDLGGTAGDVFGLGMIAAEWFLGSLPGADDAESDFARIRGLQAETGRLLRTSTTLPAPLAVLLADMVREEPKARPLMGEVTERIGRYYDDIVSGWDDRVSDRPYLVMFMPKQSDETITRWFRMRSAATKPGEEALAAFIRDDLRGARAVWSRDGALGFVENEDKQKLEAARYVLVGSEVTYFCHPYEKRRGQSVEEVMDDVLLIAFVQQRDQSNTRERLRPLEEQAQFCRVVPSVDTVSSGAGRTVLERLRRGRSSWQAMFDTVGAPSVLHPDHETFLSAMEFLLEYQGAVLQGREYAFVADEVPDVDGQVTLQWDRERDLRRPRLSGLQSKLLGHSHRPSFADFFAEAGGDAGASPEVEIFDDDRGRRGRETLATRLRLAGHRGRNTVVLTVNRRFRPPARGWIRLCGDGGTHTQLRNQATALTELRHHRILLAQLTDPYAARGMPGRWEDPSGLLEGEGKDAVLDLLDHDPLYALQGPPGTGKTEVGSQAVATWVTREPTDRILISAQSHFALDNLAHRVLTKLGLLNSGRAVTGDVAAVRLYRQSAVDKVDRTIQAFGADEAAQRLVNDLGRRLTSRLDSRTDPADLRPVLEQWRAAVPSSHLELAERLRRGANIVFATCGAATRQSLVENGSDEPFDWVLVEEAARAWPTELALPLVRGLRWTLIGDQSQIGAFSRTDVERALRACRNDPDPEVAEHGERVDDYLRWFDTFGGLFTGAEPVPARRLYEQRRMVRPIAEVVGRAFYSPPADPDDPPDEDDLPPNGLITMRDDTDHGLVAPHQLTGRPLVWLDTTGIYQDRGYWSNPHEAEVIARLVRSMRPEPALDGRRSAGRRSIAVVTPYRGQVDELRKLLPEARDVISTVDAFQGRDADLVVVSLVRDRVRDDSGENPYPNLGHLADPARVNVMLSRARDLMVIVGRFAHYAESGVPHWETVTTAVERFGTRLRAESLS